MQRNLVGLVATLVALIGPGLAPAASADTIRVQSTTDTIDAGLVDDLLKPLYAQAQPGDTLQYVGVGTGRALDNARNGLADVVITHAPSLEQLFVSDGFSLEPSGRAIFYSDYVIVGPRDDPAAVGAASTHDAISALEAVASAGGGGTATFVSRGDNSGTNVQEQLMWGMTTGVPIERASNAGTATDRFEPSSGGRYPDWYGPKTSKGQAANLQDADACSAGTYPNGGCYTLVDRGTFNRLVNSGIVTHMAIVSQLNGAGARGGKDLLINPFSVYVVNPDAIRTLPSVNVTAAQRFVDFLVSQQFQDAVDSYPTTTDPAFHADAFPRVTVTSPPAATATAGTQLTWQLAFANRQPGAPAVNGMPVQLQASTDGGVDWSDAGAAQSTNAAGGVTLTATIARTTAYRVALPRFQATSWNAFSSSTQDVGVVSVAAVPRPRRVDRRDPHADGPRVSRLVLGHRGLTLRVGEPATLKATIAKRIVRHVQRHGRPRTIVAFRTLRVAKVRARGAGRIVLRWSRALAPGHYRVRLRATDAEHKVTTVSIRRGVGGYATGTSPAR